MVGSFIGRGKENGQGGWRRQQEEVHLKIGDQIACFLASMHHDKLLASYCLFLQKINSQEEEVGVVINSFVVGKWEMERRG